MERIVLKLSGEQLANAGGDYDKDVINKVAFEIKKAMETGSRFAIVVGGGNYWRGRDKFPEIERTKSDQIGMLGTVMNGIFLSEIFRLNGINSVVMTPFQIGSMTELFSRDKALDYMQKRFVVINSGGSGHPYFSTDFITALRAAELNAFALYAKNVDGVYNKDPVKHPDAKKYRNLTYTTVLRENLNAIDLAAAAVSKDAGLESFVFDLKEADVISGIANGNDDVYKKGTRIMVTTEEEFYVY